MIQFDFDDEIQFFFFFWVQQSLLFGNNFGSFSMMFDQRDHSLKKKCIHEQKNINKHNEPLVSSRTRIKLQKTWPKIL